MKTTTNEAQLLKLTAFLNACGLDTTSTFSSRCTGLIVGKTSGGRTIMHARIGEQSKKFKRAILKAGWEQIESLNLGGGERELSFTHPDIEGGISMHEFRDSDYLNKIYLSN